MIATGYVTIKRERLICHALRASGHPGASICRLVGSARKPLEQPHAKALLQRLQPAERSGMVDPEHSRRRRQAAGTVNRKHESKFEGITCAYKVVNDGRRQIVGFHLPGDAPDLQSVHLKKLDVGIATMTRCKIGFVPHNAILEVCERYPRITGALWRQTLVDAAIFREWVANLGQRSGPMRIAHLLCELFERFRVVGLAHADTIDFPLTQTEIGDAMGLSAVHVNRSLKKLREDGYIAFKNGTLQVLDWEGLQLAADFSPDYLHLREHGG